MPGTKKVDIIQPKDFSKKLFEVLSLECAADKKVVSTLLDYGYLIFIHMFIMSANRYGSISIKLHHQKYYI